MKRFKCVCGDSCRDFSKCKKTRMVMRPCGRSNPALGDFPAKVTTIALTKEQRRVMRKHTAIHCVGGVHVPILTVGVQSFKLSEGTREHARFIRKMLAVALTNLIHNTGREAR